MALLIKTTEMDIVTSNAIMEQWLAENQVRPKVLTVEMLADIILYKSKNIKAHIPAWVFEETFNVLREDCENH